MGRRIQSKQARMKLKQGLRSRPEAHQFSVGLIDVLKSVAKERGQEPPRILQPEGKKFRIKKGRY